MLVGNPTAVSTPPVESENTDTVPSPELAVASRLPLGLNATESCVAGEQASSEDRGQGWARHPFADYLVRAEVLGASWFSWLMSTSRSFEREVIPSLGNTW